MTRIAALACATALILSACAQPEPEPVYMHASIDKAGNAHCMDGYVVSSNSMGETICMPGG